ncbi:5'/3'-nucleotidase SurE [Halobaculum gomorrense]|uniref:5'-nucleotidase SurE n=1 Tax=Halobaculum gomorrense TaxID=43928 RepID=A0A1M5Q2H2_9EURY|nr:5'/3'-nucleotidase SurE [Halobaculum gomorrense]SHH08238.1 5'-nucleotidase /3'-nucleotidase /exopolyphosphatase [Halobaculum gomorrense]
MTDSQARVLLTNDDGVDAAGLAALYEELRAVADVTVVAPAENQSGVGRARSRAVDVNDHEWGHAVHGTPADCVAYALRALETEFDLVVSGCNHGPNCGEYIMGHSGTVGAAVEAAYLGVPAVAVSAYHREKFFPPAEFTFETPARLTRLLAERVLDRGGDDVAGGGGAGVGDGGGDHVAGGDSRADLADADLLSVNAPVDADGCDLRLTEPLADYGVDVREASAEERETHDGDWRLESDFWARLDQPGRHPTLEQVGDSYPAWSDRAAVVDGDASVSPLRVPQTAVHSERLDDLIAAVNRAWRTEREAVADDD